MFIGIFISYAVALDMMMMMGPKIVRGWGEEAAMTSLAANGNQGLIEYIFFLLPLDQNDWLIFIFPRVLL